MSQNTITLHIPDGINYDCTGCGKCCGGWAVPMTEADFQRVSSIEWVGEGAKYNDKGLYRKLKPYEMANSPYTHAIKEAENGHCPYLVENLCFIHREKGEPVKPSICQLFPYCFNETPSGIYTTVSFVSMAVIYNTGRSLVDQRDYIEKKYEDFQALYPNHHPNWSKLQLTVGQTITRDEYLDIEAKMLDFIKDSSLSLDERLVRCSAYLTQLVASAKSSSAMPSTDGTLALNNLDRVLFSELHKMYYPLKTTSRGDRDFSVGRFVYQAAFGSAMGSLKIAVPGQRYSLAELDSIKWDESEGEINDLLYRYIYSKVFAKLYFGAGFGQLSVIAGFHHLVTLFALVRWHAKALARARGVNQAGYLEVATSLKLLEKGIGETAVGPYAAAAFELLLASHQRLRRTLKHSA